ncbi:MAG: DUF3592 domain-containing protein [Sulfuritalea sp.]|nr:DUF3592 domain-containing protein [Sulfuritalea sp.]
MSSRSAFFKIAGIVIGVALIGYGFSERSSLAHAKAIGRPAVVEPIKNYTKHKSTYISEFTFMTEKGERVTKKQSFPSELISDFEAGAPVKVLYNPSSPSEFVFEKEKPSWFLVLGGIAFAVLSVLFV